MPYRNRVTPTGEIIATPARGLFMGNRGKLLNSRGELARTHQGKRWITCLLDFKDRWRPVMTPGVYTELFFLDEATALAAGHRPCAECRRADFNRFMALWREVNGGSGRVEEVDDRLHQERLTDEKPHLHTLSDLPDGTFVQSEDGRMLLVWQGSLWRWTPFGYVEQLSLEQGISCTLLTPLSTVRVLAAGYRPVVHPSAQVVPVGTQEGMMATSLHQSEAGSVRAARLADANAITESHLASWQTAYRGILPDQLLDNLSIEGRLSFWQQVLTDEKDPIFVVEQGDRVVGFVSCGPSRDEEADSTQVAEIYAIYLHPDVWGNGHGRRLSDAALAHLTEQGFREVTLWVLRDNQRARRFYERVGFTPDGSNKIDTWRGEAEFHEVRYRDRLETNFPE